MEPVVAVVPIKRLDEAKGRLRPRLDGDERAALVIDLLRATLRTLEASGVVAERVVVSPDERALAVARAAGGRALRQHGGGLNAALTAARAATPAGTTLLIVPGDLPLLRPGDILAALALAGAAPSVVIAPDRAEHGTNLLLLRPAGELPFLFGPWSFRRHQAAARALNLAARVYHSPGTAFDLDTPDDLDALGWESPLVAPAGCGLLLARGDRGMEDG